MRKAPAPKTAQRSENAVLDQAIHQLLGATKDAAKKKSSRLILLSFARKATANASVRANFPAMSTIAEIESAVMGLSPQDRAQLVTWLDDHRNELLPGDDGTAEIAEAQRREVLRRRDELIANPALAQKFDDGYFDRLRKKVADVRAGKASAG